MRRATLIITPIEEEEEEEEEEIPKGAFDS